MTAVRVNDWDAFDPGLVTCTVMGLDADGVTVTVSAVTVSGAVGLVTAKSGFTPVNSGVTVCGPAPTGTVTDGRVPVRLEPLVESETLPTLVVSMKNVTPVAGDWPSTKAGDSVAVSFTVPS